MQHATAPATVRVISILVLLDLIFGCSGLSLDCYWRSDPYVLIAIDAQEQMSLAVDQGSRGAFGIVNATVFAIGADAKYIVVKQHPEKANSLSFDRSVTNYFVVERTTSTKFLDVMKGVSGPMTKEEFEKLAIKKSLPPFTKTFPDLE